MRTFKMIINPTKNKKDAAFCQYFKTNTTNENMRRQADTRKNKTGAYIRRTTKYVNLSDAYLDWPRFYAPL